MRELPQRHRPLLEGRRIVVASADRVLISGLVHSLDGIGSLVGAASTETEALACLRNTCLLYTSPSPRDLSTSRMPSSA